MQFIPVQSETNYSEVNAVPNSVVDLVKTEYQLKLYVD